MKRVYALTEWSQEMKQVDCKLFMSIEGAAKWLAKKDPVGNTFKVMDRDIEGDYDINEKNLAYVFKVSKDNGCAASFLIKQEFPVFGDVETRFTFSAVDVND